MGNTKENSNKKLIAIFSNDSDFTTNDVCDWTTYFGHDCIIIKDINKQSTQLKIVIDKDSIMLTINGRTLSSIWFRKYWETMPFWVKDKIRDYISFHIEQELKVFNSAIMLAAVESIKNVIGSNFIVKGEMDINKQQLLYLAAKCGLNTPSTIISNCKEDIICFLQNYKNVIVKPLSDQASLIVDNNVMYSTYTEMISEKDIQKLSDMVFPCFLQEYIEKEFEIRIFYLKNKMYSSAIFSQLNKQTTIDFRKYIKDKEHRIVPFQLPKSIEKSIQKLMKAAGLNTGSIDMIYSEKGDYVFLEVNPVGQFGMISEPCNYYLEKKVAEELIN